MKYKFNEDELFFEINLEDELGGKVFSSAARRLIAEDLINKIIERADDGKGFDSSTGRVASFKPKSYSEGYRSSMEFEAFGKTKNDVNLQLTGSMMSSIDLLSDDSTKIRIGINNRDAPKAHGHQTGGGYLPKRPFLGVTKEDLDEIKDKYKDAIGERTFTVSDLFEEQAFAGAYRELVKRGFI